MSVQVHPTMGLTSLADVTCNLDGIAHDGRCGRTCARTLTEEHAVTHGIARDVDGVIDAVDIGKLMVRGNHGRMDADVNLAIDLVGDGEELDGVAHILRMPEIHGLDGANALREDVIECHAGVEGDGGENRDLRGSVIAVDVGRRVGLGITELLRALEHRIVIEALLHLGEHVVGRAIDNAKDGIDLVADERMLEGLDDGDAATYGRLEGDFDAMLVGGVEDFSAARRHEGLVGGDHVFSRAQGIKHDVSCHARPANELDDDVDIWIIDDILI